MGYHTPTGKYVCIFLTLLKICNYKIIEIMSLKEEIAQKLKARRIELGLTMEELAILVWGDPAKRAQISNYENGKRAFSLDTLELFLEALQMNLILQNK
ncbi:Helix-turn-helix domain [Myroides odoratus]|uniref:Helix-turn-helix domain n=2 Tax=Myroides odoratus TaxID=256 RepID=A0A378RNN2_MYROD|nr:Helix-turn-helix domain [Myroides odoratus]